jgi:hypothetical protein
VRPAESASRRERLGAEGQALASRRVEQAALARQATVDPRDPAGGLELDGGGGLALDGGVGRQEAARDEGVGAAEAARGRLGAQALPEGLGGGGVAVVGRSTSRGLSAPLGMGSLVAQSSSWGDVSEWIDSFSPPLSMRKVKARSGWRASWRRRTK